MGMYGLLLSEDEMIYSLKNKSIFCFLKEVNHFESLFLIYHFSKYKFHISFQFSLEYIS